MILYIQTPAIPRSKLHNQLIKTMISHLDRCKQFSEIRWFINIDAIKTSQTNKGRYEWESTDITKDNFTTIASELINTKTNINISYNPCFYLAFRHLTNVVIEDVDKLKLKNSEYCVMWLEDDWSFTDIEGFDKNLNTFLSNDELECYILYRNKINMGGNPDIVKGHIFELFRHINLEKTNKRDPENIRKHDVWYPNVFIDPWKHPLEISPYNLLLQKLIAINNDINHKGRNCQKKTLSVNVVEGEQGDKWRANLNVVKKWGTKDKHGISSDKNYSYK